MLQKYWVLLLPAALCVLFACFWLAVGFGPLNRAELPLARLIHSAAGTSDLVDRQIIFFNRWWGEAACVLAIFTAFFVVATIRTPIGGDRRRIVGFAGVIFATWFFANAVGGKIIEPTMPRESPSFMLGEHFTDLAERHQRKVKMYSGSSFPSNHGTVFMIVVVMSMFRYGRGAWVLLPVAAVLSLPRCFTGAHWVSDSLIGSLLMTWMIGAMVMATPLRVAVDLAERAATIVLPPFFAGPGFPEADCGAPAWALRERILP